MIHHGAADVAAAPFTSLGDAETQSTFVASALSIAAACHPDQYPVEGCSSPRDRPLRNVVRHSGWVNTVAPSTDEYLISSASGPPAGWSPARWRARLAIS